MDFNDDILNSGTDPEQDDFHFDGSFDDLLASLDSAYGDKGQVPAPQPDFVPDPEPQHKTSQPLLDPDPVTKRAVPQKKNSGEPTREPSPALPVNAGNEALSEPSTDVPKKRDSEKKANTGKRIAGKKKTETPSAAEAGQEKGEKQEKGDWEPYREKLQKKNRHFTVALVIYILVFALLAAGGVYFLNGYLESYEKSRPVHYMERLMQNFTDEDWFALMLEHFDIPISEFENVEDIQAAYEEAIIDPNSEIKFRKKIGVYTDEEPVYAISAGSRDIMLFHLESDKTRSAGNGFYYWKPGDIEVLANGSGLSSATIEVEAPKGAALLLNGKPVSDRYIVDDHVPYTLSELEERFSEHPFKNRYEISGLYLNYELKIGDSILEPYDESDNHYYYRVDADHTYSLKITAMSDMTVTVNGAELLAEDAVFQEDYPVLKGLSAYVESVPQIYTWKYSGLLTEPQITATDSLGKSLEPKVNEDGSYEFSYQPSKELEESVGPRALEFMKAYIKYAADDGNNTDSNYYKVVSYVLKDSDLRTTLYSSYIGGMHWGGVLSYTVNDVGVRDFISYGENCFSCVGYFDITQVTHYETKSINNVYTLIFVKSGGTWYAVAMNI